MLDTSQEEIILKKALELYQDEMLSGLPDDHELDSVTFSPAFEKRMRHEIFRRNHPALFRINTAGNRVACLLIVLFITLTASALSSRALANPVVDFFVQAYEKFSSIVFSPKENASSTVFAALSPEKLPAGFRLQDEKFDCDIYHCAYTDGTGQYFLFDQSFLHDSAINFDTEGAVSENIRVRGTVGLYVEKKGIRSILWSDDTYSYILSGTLSRDELLHIAESLKNSG